MLQIHEHIKTLRFSKNLGVLIKKAYCCNYLENKAELPTKFTAHEL